MNGAYDEYKDKMKVDSMVIVEGSVSTKSNAEQPSVFANTIEPLETAREKRIKAVHITISTLGLEKSDIEPLLKTCENHPGDKLLWINLKTVSSGNYRFKSKHYKVSADPSFIRDLRAMLGHHEVWLS
jgi:DNA polymerase III alpha subunit